MTSALSRLLGAVDEARVASLTERAVRVYSPSGAEGPASSIFEEALLAAGVPCTRQPLGADGRYNVVARLGPAPLGLLFIGHVDTIRLLPGEELVVAREGDVLHGLGAADMKGGCAALVEAMVALASSGVPLMRGVVCALVVGEEEIGDGALALKREHQAALTVVGEPTALVPCVSHYGYVELDLYARGRRAHAALPEQGANAIEPMARWVLEVSERLRALDADVVVNVRELVGGNEMFVVPERCEASLDVHFPARVAPEQVEAVVESVRHELATGDVELCFERTFTGRGYALDGDPPHLAPVRRAFAHVGLPFQPGTFRSHSDASHLRAERADAAHPLVCGPGRLEVAHVRHEHVDLREVATAARLYAALAWEACGAEG